MALKIAIVTGGARGIGATVAARLLKRGYHVHILDWEMEPPLQKSQFETYKIMDVSDPTAVATYFAEFSKPPEILINCAGEIDNRSIWSCDPFSWDTAIDVNLKSVYLMSRGFTTRLVDGATVGSIVNIGSVNSHFSSTRRVGYAAAKAGIEGLTRVLATQLGPTVRVNCVNLGSIQTRMTPEGSKPKCIMKRLGTPDEAASVIEFLALDASYVTGAVWNVDGGYGLEGNGG